MTLEAIRAKFEPNELGWQLVYVSPVQHLESATDPYTRSERIFIIYFDGEFKMFALMMVFDEWQIEDGLIALNADMQERINKIFNS